MRPSKFLRWPARDRRLAEALLSYEDGLCPGCGAPRDHAWDPRAEGEYEAEEHTCVACAVRHAKTDGRTKAVGEYVVVRRAAPAAPRTDPAQDP